MKFSFFGANRSILATSACALLMLLVAAPVSSAQAPAGGQAAAGQPAQKNYKDRGEYDLYSKATQTQDPKARLEVLNTWQDKYPQTDFEQERQQLFLVTLNQLSQSDPSVRPKLIDKANEVLKQNPKNFTALYYLALWGPAVGGASPSPDVLTSTETGAKGVVEGADTQFDPSKKPANVSEADFKKAKDATLAVAHNALAWVYVSRKDNAGAENEYKASLEANPNQANVSAAYAKMLIEQKKYPDGLFEYARAAQYDGPGSLPAATRTQLSDYFKKAYGQFHGSSDGADQVLAQAKDSALPPAGFKIEGQAEKAQQEADAINQRIQSDPQFKIWYAIKQSLTDRGDAFFNSDIKDAEIPGDAVPSKAFTGTVISIEPPDRPTKVVLGVEDATKPDATLVFSQPLPASALDKIKVGQKLDFSGIAESYNKDPYMLTFKDPTVPGVQTTAPARKGRARPRSAR